MSVSSIRKYSGDAELQFIQAAWQGDLVKLHSILDNRLVFQSTLIDALHNCIQNNQIDAFCLCFNQLRLVTPATMEKLFELCVQCKNADILKILLQSRHEYKFQKRSELL